MEPTKRTARLAGLLYLIVVLTGIFTLGYVPSVLFKWNSASLTFSNIKESEILFRLSIMAGIVCYTAFLILPFVLYKLLNGVNKSFAVAMVILSAVSAPISLYNLTNKISILTLIESESSLSPGEIAKLPDQVLLSLKYYENGIELISIFWGLWLFPFGYLVFKSGFLPRTLGVFLMIGCFGYLINFTGDFLLKDYSSIGIARFVSLPASIGEIGICFWLLIVGIKAKQKLPTDKLQP